MPNDAKLGLTIGVGLVVVIAVVFFRKDEVQPPAPKKQGPPAAAATFSADAKLSSEPINSAISDKTVSTQPLQDKAVSSASRRHVVQDGETLYSLAVQYYNDETRSLEIYRANREALSRTERLIPGMVLWIPEASGKAATLAKAKTP